MDGAAAAVRRQHIAGAWGQAQQLRLLRVGTCTGTPAAQRWLTPRARRFISRAQQFEHDLEDCDGALPPAAAASGRV